MCLYLALMKHTLGSEFTFAVLDDVVMSIDAGHRRALIDVLGKEFADTQFVVTTHDELWLQQMRHFGFVSRNRMVHFRDWTVDLGPTRWGYGDTFVHIRELVDSGDIRGAAALLRRHLEHEYREICDDLRAPVRFRLDGNMTLGELALPALAAQRKWIKLAKNAAGTWNRQDTQDALAAWDMSLSAASSASRQEDWAINAAVHFNAWDTFSASDFKLVVDAMETLLNEYRCGDCDQPVKVAELDGKPSDLRCGCGKRTYSLLEKPKAA